MARPPDIIVNLPNLITLLRILVTPLFVILMLKGEYRLSLLVFFLAGISDALDGLLARWFDQKSLLGAHLDPLADKLLLSAAFIMLAVQETIPSWLTVVVISRDLLILAGIAILRFFHVAMTIRPSMISKCTTAAQLATAFLALLGFEIAAARIVLAPLFWVTMILTLVSGLHYVVRGVAILKQENPDFGA